MKKLLHIIATPRDEESRTLKVSKRFLDAFKESHPEWVVEELNLTKEALPSLTVKRVDGKYILLGGKELSGQYRESWREIIEHIERFLSADWYLISTPMWNFTIPYILKHYIDIIVQPKYLFRYVENGVEGLAKGRKMTVITSRGGNYSLEATKGMDFQEPYLRAVFGFVGVTDITFINTQPMDMGKELQEEAIRQKQKEAEEAARKFV